ncbi:MAG: DUF1576 domain-containing protein [Clostridium sp.]|nr:DUF1576 domain-containing protein [Clostridium sp.]
MGETEKIEKTKVRVLLGLSAILILMGMCVTPNVHQILEGFKKLVTATALLDANTFMIVDGALGVPFINSGLLVLFVIVSYQITKTKIGGGQIAALFMVLGFGFCGKNIFNVWPFVLGVMLHTKLNRKPLSSSMNLAWFSAALCPVFNMIAFYTNYGAAYAEPHFAVSRILVAVVVGIFAGYLIAFLAGILPGKHNGFTLYNAGMAAGIAGFLIFSFLKALKLGHDAPAHEYPNIANGLLALMILILLVYLGVCGLIINRGVPKDLKKQLVHCSKGGDFTCIYCFGTVLINMFIVGIMCLAYILIVPANLSGPVFAALFTVVGFASNGITVRTSLPIMLGVFCMAFISGGMTGAEAGESFIQSAFAYTGTKSMVIAAIYCCGLSPVTGAYGVLAGFLAGLIHCLIVPSIGPLHGWLNLYNNGFSLGIVATFYVPILERINKVLSKPKDMRVVDG